MKKLVAVFFRKCISEIEPSAAMCRKVGVIANRFDVVVDIRIHVGLGLLVINAALNNVKQMRG